MEGQLARFSVSLGPKDPHSLSSDTSGLLRPRKTPGRGSKPREKPAPRGWEAEPLEAAWV